MPFRYLLEPNSGDSHQSSPYWLALIVRFGIKDTVNREFMRGNIPLEANVSKPEVRDNPVEEAEPLLLEHEVQAWSIDQSKASPQGIGTFQLHHAGVDFRQEITAGDWILFWAFDNQDDYLRIRQNLRQNPRLRSNAFMDGFKFMGRVQGVRRRRRRNGSTGAPSTTYTLTATAFSEFSYTIYYHPAMKGKYGQNLFQHMVDFGGEINNYLLAGPVSAGDAIPALLKVCMGLGPSDEWKSGINPTPVGGTTPPPPLLASPNGRLLVPATVSQVVLGDAVGQQVQSRTYVDLLKSQIGVQRYSTQGVARRNADSAYSAFVARGFTQDINNTFLQGEFLPYAIDFNQKTMWSVLQTYANEPINELYTTLRVDPDGYIMPSFIARQMPFSSKGLVASLQDMPMTSFLDLPRWVLSSRLVDSEDLGQSDALRYNFVFLPSRDIALTGKSEQLNTTQNYVTNPPYIDTADIERSGLKMYSRMVGARINESQHSPNTSPGRIWTKLMADVMMGQHLRYTGTLDCTYIQEPVAVGDNLEYDGGIYHIERVSHQGQIDGMGRKTASTRFQVTNGLSLASDDADDNVFMVTGTSGFDDHEEASDRAPREADATARVYIGHQEDRRGH